MKNIEVIQAINPFDIVGIEIAAGVKAESNVLLVGFEPA